MNQHHVGTMPSSATPSSTTTPRQLGQLLKGDESYGPYFSSKLLTIEPIELRSYEHLEYSPLVNQRAHRVGSEWRVANPAVLEEYTQLLGILAFKPQLDAMDSMSVTYFLFLQDRVEEALARFKAIDATKLPTRLQHDYFQCYAAFYEGDLASARGLASKYADHPVSALEDALCRCDHAARRNRRQGHEERKDRQTRPREAAGRSRRHGADV
jgi:hypothetical protein